MVVKGKKGTRGIPLQEQKAERKGGLMFCQIVSGKQWETLGMGGWRWKIQMKESRSLKQD